jgi:hypothetical protein
LEEGPGGLELEPFFLLTIAFLADVLLLAVPCRFVIFLSALFFCCCRFPRPLAASVFARARLIPQDRPVTPPKWVIRIYPSPISIIVKRRKWQARRSFGSIPNSAPWSSLTDGYARYSKGRQRARVSDRRKAE